MIEKIELLQPDTEEIIVYDGPNEIEATQCFENLQKEYITNKCIYWNDKTYTPLRFIIDPKVTTGLLRKYIVSFIGIPI